MKIERDKLIGHWCARATYAFRSELESRTRRYGLSVSDVIVILVLHSRGPSSLVELSRELAHAHPSVLRNIDSLEKAGYVRRSIHPNDRRVKMVSLTEAGENMLSDVEQAVMEVQEIATEGFSSGEVDRLIQDLKRLIHNLHNAGKSNDQL